MLQQYLPALYYFQDLIYFKKVNLLLFQQSVLLKKRQITFEYNKDDLAAKVGNTTKFFFPTIVFNWNN